MGSVEASAQRAGATTLAGASLDCNAVGTVQVLSTMRKIFLYVEFPDTRPLVMHLFSLDDCVTIGRSSENLICIRDQMISRMHCKIYEANGYPAIQDMGTANGVMIRRGLFRKIKLKRGQQIYLRSGDRLQMGDYKMKIQILHGWEARA